MTRDNRKAGIKWELECKAILSEVLKETVITTRQGSRALDAIKIDLMSETGRLEFNFQCKNYAKKLDYDKVLGEMPDNELNIILHKYTEKKGKRFIAKGKFAIMTMETLYHILENYVSNKTGAPNSRAAISNRKQQ